MTIPPLRRVKLVSDEHQDGGTYVTSLSWSSKDEDDWEEDIGSPACLGSPTCNFSG